MLVAFSAWGRLLGGKRGYGQYVGLDDAWATRLIEAVGNYGEPFERKLGSVSFLRAVMLAISLL